MCKRECWAVLSHRTIEATSPSCHCFTLQSTAMSINKYTISNKNTRSQIPNTQNTKYTYHKHEIQWHALHVPSLLPTTLQKAHLKLSLHLLISCNHRWHQSREKQQQCKCGVAAAAFVEALTRAALPSNCTSLLGQIYLWILTNMFCNLRKYILKFGQFTQRKIS